MDSRARAAPEAMRVTPSIPILFFGDLAAYDASVLRIVTVGLNPSRQEFPEEAAWSRFPECAELANVDRPDDRQRAVYLGGLTRYFSINPYRPWFGWFEHVLRGARSSYYSGLQSSTALHTDIASPVATSPTWSHLLPEQRDPHSGGETLWRDLIDILAPHVIVFSVAARHASAIAGAPVDQWDELTDVAERKGRFVVRATTRDMGGRSVLLVHGRCRHVPFGGIVLGERERIGRCILERARQDGFV